MVSGQFHLVDGLNPSTGLVCVTYSDLLNAGERDPKKELMDYGLLGARAHDSHEVFTNN